MHNRVKKLLEREHGPAHLDREIVEFEADEATDAELAALPPAQLAERLIAAHAAAGDDYDADKPLKRTGLRHLGWDADSALDASLADWDG